MGGVQLSVKCVCVIADGVQGRVQSLACRRRPGGACRWRLAITVDKCCDWLQQLPHEYSNMSCLNYFISFQTWFPVKIKFFKIILFPYRRG